MRKLSPWGWLVLGVLLSPVLLLAVWQGGCLVLRFW